MPARRGREWRTIAVAASLLVLVVRAPAGAAGPLVARGCANAWTVAPQPSSTAGSGQLQGVSASSAADAWAVGSLFTDADQIGHALTQHFDGTSWSVVPSPDGPNASTSALTAVSARAADDAWAVGLSIRTDNLVRTLIDHWDGTVWTRMKSPNAGHPANGQLNGVASIAADDVWAVGSSGQSAPSRTLIQHWDGSTLSVIPSPNKGPFPNGLSAVDALAPDDIWAVGSWFTKGFVDRTLILHWDGTAWSRVPSPNADAADNGLVSIAPIATDDVWAVGFHGLHTLTMHWDGTAWRVVPSPTPGGSSDLAGVVAIAPDDVWAVGGRVDRQASALHTLVEHWDGTSWVVVDSANKGPSDNHLWGVTGSIGRMFAVGYRFRSSGGTGSDAPLTLERCGP
jgi:hypothetical protein